jgi:hypothetical protein
MSKKPVTNIASGNARVGIQAGNISGPVVISMTGDDIAVQAGDDDQDEN